MTRSLLIAPYLRRQFRPCRFGEFVPGQPPLPSIFMPWCPRCERKDTTPLFQVAEVLEQATFPCCPSSGVAGNMMSQPIETTHRILMTTSISEWQVF
jgi:hypothetical protein